MQGKSTISSAAIRSLMFGLMSLSSCAVLKESPKYKFTDGVYRTRDTNAVVWVYVENEEDSMLVYRIEKGKAHEKQRRQMQSPKVYASGGFRVLESERETYWKNTFDVDIVTMPLKFRPATSAFPPQLSNHLNGDLYIGYRRDIYRLSYSKNPLGRVSQHVTHLGVSGGLATGFGVTPMNSWVTQNNIDIEYDGFIWSKAVCVIVAVEKLNFGLALGIDHLMESNKAYWIYQGKPYLALSIGLNLN